MTAIADHIDAKAVLKQAELALYRAGRRIGDDPIPVEAITDAVVAMERAMLAERLAQEAGQPEIHERATKIHTRAGRLIDALTRD